MNWKDTYENWINNPQMDEILKKELLLMSDTEKEDAFYRNLEFGTAGMRGVLGAGTNRMNIYTIRKANTGFANYILTHGEDAQKRGIVIAHDSRHMSKEFAAESAKIMASKGIKTYLFDELRSTPELSFAVRHLNAFAGIVITASHNPKTYNGYKIYDETGCQCIPEEAAKVVKEVEAITNELSLTTDTLQNYLDSGMVQLINEEVDAAYNEAIVKTTFEDVPKNNVSIVYTSLHGTGHIPVKRAFDTLGYTNIHLVEEQCKPDANFTTVPLPNPEDPKVFDLAATKGKAINADVLLATDPDADRLGIAIKQPDGEYKLLNGNITGALMTYYILDRLQAHNKLSENGIIFTTVVTSDFAEKIAASYDIPTERTLTGFKFIGDRIRHYEQTKEKQFLYGFEESYGSLVNADIARDKDAVQAVIILTEMVAYYKEQGKTLLNLLEELQQKFGYFQESLQNIALAGIEGAAQIKKLITTISEQPFNEMNGQAVTMFENYITSIRYQNGTEEQITLPKSDVLKFYLADGSWFCVRPSGTEPKAKVYIAVTAPTESAATNTITSLEKAIMTEVDKILGK